MEETKRAGRRYALEFGGAMLSYAVVVLVVAVSVGAVPRSSPLRVLLALLPMVPLVFALWAFTRHFGRMDELQRRIQLEALAFAFGGTALLTFGYGFLQAMAGYPRLSWFFVWPVMGVLWMAGVARAGRRYR